MDDTNETLAPETTGQIDPTEHAGVEVQTQRTPDVVIVCGSNATRSPALAILLQALRPDLVVESAAVGLNAKPGLRIPPKLRALLAADGFGEQADAYRSRLLKDVGFAPIMVATGKVHYKRLQAAGMGENTKFVYQLEIPDPVWEGADGMEKVYPQIKAEAQTLADQIPQ